MTAVARVRRRRYAGLGDQPVELRFVDMLLIIIATLVFVAVMLSVTSAFSAAPPAAAGPRIATTAPPTSLVGRDYRLTLAVLGGAGPIQWRLVSGSLPTGLRLAADGTVEGKPLRRADTVATVEVTDAGGRTDRRVLSFGSRRVAPDSSLPPVPPPPLRIPAPVSLLYAVKGREYRHAFSPDTGTAPFQWELRGKLPAGLAFGADGMLTGRPKHAGSSRFDMSITDAGGAKAQQSVVLVVEKGPKTRADRIWDWVKRIVRYAGLAVFAWLILFGFGGERIPGLLELLSTVAGGRRATRK
ncbi:putative Ig domain-containing protein [Actinomadura rupiterrae]|uniref:putative Ig domain-containing protein n=1 Tax=Actinomadura rupiterrae TaxID=559627 RepID=UPI0020A495FF|nr:putative Ig domain-containing protein [Actinomadura rupiterrae]MCP2334701.1 hypothetical protein [Actinomadura rupiterrae]